MNWMGWAVGIVACVLYLTALFFLLRALKRASARLENQLESATQEPPDTMEAMRRADGEGRW